MYAMVKLSLPVRRKEPPRADQEMPWACEGVMCGEGVRGWEGMESRSASEHNILARHMELRPALSAHTSRSGHTHSYLKVLQGDVDDRCPGRSPHEEAGGRCDRRKEASL